MEQRNNENIATLIAGILFDFGDALTKISRVITLAIAVKEPAKIEQKKQIISKEDKNHVR